MKPLLRAGLLAGALMIGAPGASLGALGEPPKVTQILIEHMGPHAASDPLILANIRSKSGETFSQTMVDEDIKNLYATGFFSSIRVSEKASDDGVQLTFFVQGKPILTDLKIVGNKEYSVHRLMKKVTSRVGDPLDEHKLFTDAREIQKYYQDNGYQKTVVKALPPAIDATAGKGTATIEIVEAPKIKIKDIVFDGMAPFKDAKGEMVKHPQRTLRGVLKTKRRWMFSWLTGSGIVKEDEFEDDKERLVEYFQNEGYIDFGIKDVAFYDLSPKWQTIHFNLSVGRQYKVGALDFKGNTLYSSNDFLKGVELDKEKFKVEMISGKVFTPVRLSKDTETLRDFYGAKGYVDARIHAQKDPNPATGTMDVAYGIEEGDKSYIEKILIKGNNKTRDRVLRRELAVAPGESFDMVRVKRSKGRLEQLNFFEKVDAQPEETDVPNRKNLVIGVEEKSTGNFMVGAGFSSVDSLMGYVEVTQNNFDLFAPPTFTGDGQKMSVRAQVGNVQQVYQISFVEPWFLGRKLMLGVDLFYRDLGYVSLNDIYDEIDAGGSVYLRRALGSENLVGRVGYTLEDVDISINSGYHTNIYNANGSLSSLENVSQEIYDERGSRLVSKIDASLAYDTRNSVQLADRGQRTEFLTEFAGLGGDSDFYKLELRTHWYFKGLARGHVLEVVGSTGFSDVWGSTDHIPIFDRWFLGGMYSLRGYHYREVGPEDENKEPLGGDTYWFGSLEYSMPVVDRVRFAIFYDIGNVDPDPYSFDPGKLQTINPNTGVVSSGDARQFYNDDVGVGLRINLPAIGPLRLDYGIPITHDPSARTSGRFQFGIGFDRQF